MNIEHNEHDIFIAPWKATAKLPWEWMQENYKNIVLHPKQIVARSLPMADFWADCASAAGVYFLISCNRIVYVGITSQYVFDRAHNHVADKVFDSISVIPLPWENRHLKMIESIYIEWLYPLFNHRWQGAGFLKPIAELLENDHGSPREWICELGDLTDQQVSQSKYLMHSRGHYIAPRDCEWKREARQLAIDYERAMDLAYPRPTIKTEDAKTKLRV